MIPHFCSGCYISHSFLYPILSVHITLARMSLSAIGYGPRHRLFFDGDERKFELWEVKLLGYMRLQKLHHMIDSLASDTSAADVSKNTKAFEELIQLLDDSSLSFKMRDAMDDGPQALKILREHYLSKGKQPKIISLNLTHCVANVKPRASPTT